VRVKAISHAGDHVAPASVERSQSQRKRFGSMSPKIIRYGAVSSFASRSARMSARSWSRPASVLRSIRSS